MLTTTKAQLDGGRLTGEGGIGYLGCDLKLDSGKPTVRDYRGALGNIDYGGIRFPFHRSKEWRSVTPLLRCYAPSFYPNRHTVFPLLRPPHATLFLTQQIALANLELFETRFDLTNLERHLGPH